MNIKFIEEYPALLAHLNLKSMDDASQDHPILTYMACMALHAANQLQRVSSFFSLPFIYTGELSGGRSYRIITNTRLPIHIPGLPCVGFISKKRALVAEEVQMSITDVDKNLVLGMVKQPGLLSYSSLQLADGNWCNLVLFEQPDAKQDIFTASLHQHAAYKLAPQYYQWIRLHHGLLVTNHVHVDSPFAGAPRAPEASGDQETDLELILHVTRYYTFHTPYQQPSIQVQAHLPATAETVIL